MKKQPELGSKISELRNQINMTQQELADKCRVDIRTIQRIETGEVLPRKHTLKLLAQALDGDISLFQDAGRRNEKFPSRAVRLAIAGGILFSLIYLPLIYTIITKSFSGSLHVLLVIVYSVSCVFFERGFYELGKYWGNQVMIISSLSAMVLLPLLNVLEVLTDFGFFSGATVTVYSLACVTGIASGIGFMIEANKRGVNYKVYGMAGILAIVQSILFMIGTDPMLVAIPLSMSVLYNGLLVALLYVEHRGVEKSFLTGEVMMSK
jgi:transcriptional regulator with XRE-family HTH domain